MTEDQRISHSLGDPAELERFRTENPYEINRVLRDLARRAEMATLYFNAGGDFVLTSLLHVDSDAQRVYLEHGADAAANERLLKADKVLFVSSQNRVRVQFTIDSIVGTELNGAPAFAIPFPPSIIRVQRREFYRLNTPVAAPLVCHFRAGEQEIAAKVVDISLGGIGLLEPGDVHGIQLEPGDVLEGCTIELPEEGLIETAIEVRNHFPVTDKNGAQKRIGCRFLSLSPRMNAQIQRYIHRIELERRRRVRGQ